MFIPGPGKGAKPRTRGVAPLIQRPASATSRLNARYLAEHIPGAKLVELPGVDHVPWIGDAVPVLNEVEIFLTGGRGRHRGSALGIGIQALTRREREIVRMAIGGESAVTIGRRLFIGDRTVETHLANAYIKLGVASRVELVRRSEELGI
jgi:DNA-binding CsgD family transcriptional regulator